MRTCHNRICSWIIDSLLFRSTKCMYEYMYVYTCYMYYMYVARQNGPSAITTCSCMWHLFPTSCRHSFEYQITHSWSEHLEFCIVCDILTFIKKIVSHAYIYTYVILFVREAICICRESVMLEADQIDTFHRICNFLVVEKMKIVI